MKEIRPLRRYRLTRGWTLGDVAERLIEIGREAGEDNLGVDGLMVGRWERGERRPGPPYPKLLCILYQVTAWELGIVGDSPDAELCGRLEDVDRRDVLRLLSLALGTPVLLRGEAEADRLAHALSRPSRADHKTVSVVEAAIANARRLDDLAGSRVAVQPALAQRDVIRDLLRGRPSEAVAQCLLVAAAEVTQLLGWLAFGMNQHTTSRRYYWEALELAHEAGNEALGAYVLGHLSMLVGDVERASDLRSPGMAGRYEGLAFAQAASSRVSTTGSAATRSWLATQEARALSDLHDAVGAERALDRARTAFAEFRTEEEPPWMYYYDTGYLDGDLGLVYLALGRTEPARQSVEAALERLDPSMVRDRAYYLSRLAKTFVADGEVDEACRLAGEALAIATDTQDDRVASRVRELREQLERWASEPTVRELDDRLAATTAWFHPGSA